MQSLSKKLKRATIPEYYLYWTYSSNEFLKHPLYTYDNKPLSILFPGTRNSDNGPDFNGALLQIGDTILRGDVEFHIHWQDWFRHGHHFDRRYDQVILHILWEHPEYLPESLSRRFSHLILSNYLNLPFSSWLKAMEQMQFDKPPIKINSSANLPNLSTLENIAWKRFLRKCEELRFWIENRGWEETLYLGLAQVLGYSKNSSAFVELLLRFPPSRLLQTVHLIRKCLKVFICFKTFGINLLIYYPIPALKKICGILADFVRQTILIFAWLVSAKFSFNTKILLCSKCWPKFLYNVFH